MVALCALLLASGCSTAAGPATAPAPSTASGARATSGTTDIGGLLTARIGGATFRLRDTPTAADQQRGLSVVEGLADDEGMLFRLGGPKVQGMWMKDMRYAIDILWVGADGTVVHLEHDVAPATYPTVFQNPPDRLAVAVVELAAGAARRTGIVVGSPVDLDGIR